MLYSVTHDKKGALDVNTTDYASMNDTRKLYICPFFLLSR